jgi:uncharacterized protein YebE (UPF0316 family)
MTLHILLIGLLIFLARIADVSIGTLRTIVTVQGRSRLAFVLGFFEVTIWVTVISAMVKNIETAPLLAIFYGLGFATGNVVGIWAERRLALGHVALRVFSRITAPELPELLRANGQAVTVFTGEGRPGAPAHDGLPAEEGATPPPHYPGTGPRCLLSDRAGPRCRPAASNPERTHRLASRTEKKITRPSLQFPAALIFVFLF